MENSSIIIIYLQIYGLIIPQLVEHSTSNTKVRV